MNNIYFDNSATTRLDEEVLNVMIPYLKENEGKLTEQEIIEKCNLKAPHCTHCGVNNE